MYATLTPAGGAGGRLFFHPAPVRRPGFCVSLAAYLHAKCGHEYQRRSEFQSRCKFTARCSSGSKKKWNSPGGCLMIRRFVSPLCNFDGARRDVKRWRKFFYFETPPGSGSPSSVCQSHLRVKCSAGARKTTKNSYFISPTVLGYTLFVFPTQDVTTIVQKYPPFWG